MIRNRVPFVAWPALILQLSLSGSTVIASSQSIPSLDDALIRVSRNVQEFQNSLPDFECREKITSTSFERNGSISVKRVIDSVFTGRQQDDGRGHSYTESRDVKAIDGVPAAKGQPVPTLPFQFGGGFSASVVSTFAPEILQYRTFRMAGIVNVGATPALRIDLATKNGQRKLQMTSRGTKFIVKDSGYAWIDPASMQVLRLERHFTDFPNFSSFSTIVDYGETEIGGKTFWMPKTVRANATDSQTRKAVEYLAEYGQCRRYSATVEFNFGE
jgi:hypothetical protein